MFADRVVADMEPNYSGEFEEPVMIPTRLPLLMMNGSEGIAVGVAANIPPHNLKELVSAIRAVLRKKRFSTQSDFKTARELMRWIKGPDYPEGGVLISPKETVRNLYARGHGMLTYRCSYHLDKVTNGYTITVTSGCPRWNIPKFVEQCQQLVLAGGLGWVENQSSEQIKVVCYARDKAKLLDNILPLLTRRIRYNWLALDENKHVIQFNLWTYINAWLDYRRKVVKRHLQHELDLTKRQLEADDAKLRAAEDLAKTMKALRSKKPLEALQEKLGLNKRQAKVILNASIRTLTNKGEVKQRHIVSELEQYLSHCQGWLDDIDGKVLAELDSLQPYFDQRKTELGEC